MKKVIGSFLNFYIFKYMKNKCIVKNRESKVVKIEILLVKDDRLEASDLKQKLESLGYIVSYLASSMEEAIEKAMELKPDLVLIYTTYKGVIELADETKGLSVPFMYLIDLEEANIHKVVLTCPNGYISKSFNLKELKIAMDFAFKKIVLEEERYRSLFEYIGSCVAVYQAVDDGKDFVFKDFNRAAERVEQVKRENILGRRVTEVFPGVKDFGLLEVLQRVYKTGQPEHFPISQYKDDRISGWRDNFVYKLPSGEIVAVYEDVTKYKQLEEELKEREQLYRNIVETAHEGVMISHPEQGILYTNQRFQEMIGYSKEELKGHIILEFLSEGQETLIKDLRKKCQRGKKVEITLKFQRKDGSILWTLTKASPLFDNRGNYIGNLTMHTDITNRKKALEDLKRSENYYRAIFENTSAATIIVDEDTTILSANKEFEKLSGYSKQEIEGKKSWTEFPVEDDLEKMKKYHYLRRKDPQSVPNIYNFRFRDRQGKIKYIQLNVGMIPDTRKSVASLIDITQLKETENKIREREEKYRAVVETAAEGIVILDKSGKIVEVNKKALEFSGLKKEDVIGKNFIRILSKVKLDPKDIISEFKKILKGEKVKKRIRTLTNPKGEQVSFIAHYALLKKKGKIIGLSIIIEDVTERCKAEEEIRASLREKEMLLREIHHRVKNNLQVISSLLSLQIQNMKEEEICNMLQESRGRIKTMAMVHERLYQSPSLMQINFKEYVEKLVTDIFFSYGTEKIKKKIEVDDIHLNIDTAIPCGLIINELVTNSVKHAFPDGKGTITIKLTHKDGKIQLTIADDGIGLPKNFDLENMDTLGLKLVDNLVSQLEGEIILNRSHGTLFKIVFKELK